MMSVGEDQLWPVPHDGRFDFEATADGAEWIDRIAAQARPLLDREVGAVVVGHTDWRVQHMLFADGRLTAVYDWASLTVMREPRLVGSVAHAFTTSWAAETGDSFRRCTRRSPSSPTTRRDAAPPSAARNTRSRAHRSSTPWPTPRGASTRTL
jgi:hypothetical protein